MLKRLVLILIFVCVSTPLVVHADAPWRVNKLRTKKAEQAIWAEASKIPLLKEKVTGRKYQILGFVRGEDMLTNKNTAMYNKMRLEAHKLGADAVMEVLCINTKWLARRCEGFAIKYLEPAPTLEVPMETESESINP